MLRDYASGYEDAAAETVDGGIHGFGSFRVAAEALDDVRIPRIVENCQRFDIAVFLHASSRVAPVVAGPGFHLVFLLSC
ncbi:MAG TPA: hypothetical protein VKE42_09555 [Candidatus Cybelea sp.]|nr:hypothetical protein [Candidatus Cybelea sp.]